MKVLSKSISAFMLLMLAIFVSVVSLSPKDMGGSESPIEVGLEPNSHVVLPNRDRFGVPIPASARLLIIAPSCLACSSKKIPWNQLKALQQKVLILTEDQNEADVRAYNLDGKSRIGISLSACKGIPNAAFLAAPSYAWLNAERTMVLSESPNLEGLKIN